MLTDAEWSALRLSLLVSMMAVAVSLPFAIAVGYRLARGRSPLLWLLDTLSSLPLILPPVVTGYLLLVLFGRQGPLGALLEQTLGIRVAFTWVGAALAAAVVGFPLMVRAIRLSFESNDRRLEIAARSLGANRLATFLTISLPLASRGIVAGSVLAFARGLGEFGATIMVAGNIPGETQTIPLAIYSMAERPHGIEQTWRLVTLCILLACAAVVASRLLERRHHA